VSPRSARDLIALPQDAWRALVDEAIRGQVDDQTALTLRRPPVLERFYRTLVAIVQNADMHLAARKAELEVTKAELLKPGQEQIAEWQAAKARYGAWRAKTLRFKAGVEMELAEVSRIRENTTATLVQGIASHRDSFPSDEDPSAQDEALWSLIDQ